MRNKLATAAVAGSVAVAGLITAGFTAPALAAAVTSPDNRTEAAAQAVTGRLDRIKGALSGLVTDGTLTQEQADKVAKTLDEKLAKQGGEWKRGPGLKMRGPQGLLGVELDVLATTLKMSQDDVRAALRDGTTLAELAEKQGVSPSALIDTLVKSGTERIDQAVKNGKLTDDQGAKLKTVLKERVTSFVEEGFPRGMGRGFGPKPGHGFGHKDGDELPRPEWAPGAPGTPDAPGVPDGSEPPPSPGSSISPESPTSPGPTS